MSHTQKQKQKLDRNGSVSSVRCVMCQIQTLNFTQLKKRRSWAVLGPVRKDTTPARTWVGNVSLRCVLLWTWKTDIEYKIRWSYILFISTLTGYRLMTGKKNKAFILRHPRPRSRFGDLWICQVAQAPIGQMCIIFRRLLRRRSFVWKASLALCKGCCAHLWTR